MDLRRKRWPALVTLIVGIAFIIGSFSLISVGQVGEILLDDDFEDYRFWPGDEPEIPDCTGYPNQEAAEDAGWVFGAPWLLVDECELYGMLVDYPDLFPFASTIQAAYCGFVNPNTGTANYNGIEVEDPVLSTDFLEIGQECSFIQASFDYWRQVESYGDPAEFAEANGSVDIEDQDTTALVDDGGNLLPAAEAEANFDRTWVTVSFYTTQTDSALIADETRLLWYKDSAWTSLEDWISAGGFDVKRPVGANFVRVSFHFEAVDNYENGYVGWFVDNVRVDCYDELPGICWDEDTPYSLRQGVVGEKLGLEGNGIDLKDYFDEGYLEIDPNREIRFFLAKEGPGGCDCGFGDCEKLGPRDPSPLPERITLSANGVLSGMVTEDMVGNYTFWVLAEGESVRGENCACHEFHLAIRSDDPYLYREQFDPQTEAWEYCCEATPAAWNLWNETATIYWDEDHSLPVPVLPDAEYGTVAYFGQPNSTLNNGEQVGGTYNTNERVKGCYCVDLSSYLGSSGEYTDYEVELGFKHFREVEYYPGGSYDRTWVEVCVDPRSDIPCEEWKWTKVESLYWDSQDPSNPAWRWEQERTGVFIPEVDSEEDEEPRLWIRFCFDSIDGYGNDYFGWAIDEVTVWLSEATFAITACPLPAGYVGEPYSHELTYTGGDAGVRFYAEGLPEGLEVVQVGDAWYIKGTPRRTGVYPVTLGMEDYEDGEIVCDLEILEQRCFFHEDFEEDPVWIWGNEWARVGPPPSDGQFSGDEPCPIEELEPDLATNHVAYYGDPEDMDYDNGIRNTGLLSLIDEPAGLDVTDARYIELSFDSCREVEQFSSGYDQTKVQVRFDTATTWHTVWYKDSSHPNSDTDASDPDDTGWDREYANHGTPFEVPTGATKMWVRFVFDSVDKWYNTYFGWMIDNIQICFADEGGLIAAEESYYNSNSTISRRSSVDELSVMNFPNPVTDVHTTTFTVRGEGVEAIKIQIFDQNETLVFEQQVEGQELEWHTDNNYGEFLANGTYFYRAYARVDGEWIPTRFEKLVILR